MKKVIKWTLFGLILCGGIALMLCYIIIPQQTKSAIDIVVDYCNRPLFIAGGSTITIGLVLYVIIRCYAKYVLGKSNEQLSEYENKVENLVANAKDYEQMAIEHYEQLKGDLSNEDNKVEYLVNYLIKVCETSPNAKIKALGEELKKGFEKYGENQETIND